MITKENYREYPAINYSMLSTLDKNPRDVNEPRQMTSDGITFGDVLDILLTQSEEKFNEEYIILTHAAEKPVGQLGEFIDELYRQHKKNDEKIEWADGIPVLNEYLIKDSYNIVGFKRDSQPKVVDRLLSEGLAYLNFLTSSENKKIITQEMYLNVLKAVQTLDSNQFTGGYWCNFYNHNLEEREVLFQVPILFKVDLDFLVERENHPDGKALFDILDFNHKEKTIQPIDLKSTSDYISQFPTSFLKWRYYLQAAYYSYGLSQVYPEYTILPFKFIVISSQQVTKPIIYQCSKEDLKVGEFGGINKITNRKVKGWRQLIEDYLWHKQNDLWEYPREVYEKDGVIELDMLKYE